MALQFTGRTEQLEQIENLIKGKQGAVFAVSGNAGIGLFKICFVSSRSGRWVFQNCFLELDNLIYTVTCVFCHNKNSRDNIVMYRFYRIFAVLSLIILLTSCADLIPTFDSIRVNVAIEDVRIEKVTNFTLFGKRTNDQRNTELSNKEHEVIRFNLTSEVDLFKHFKDTQIQIRCWVKGSSLDRTYEGWGILSEDYIFRDQSVPSIRRQDGLFAYTVYAFIDLIANDKEFKHGKPAGYLNLKEASFDQLGCAMVGATMSPLRFPRTDDFVLDYKQFVDLYEESRN